MRKLKILTFTIILAVMTFFTLHFIIYTYFLDEVPFQFYDMSYRRSVGHWMIGLLEVLVCWRSVRDDFLFVDSINRRSGSIVTKLTKK